MNNERSGHENSPGDEVRAPNIRSAEVKGNGLRLQAKSAASPPALSAISGSTYSLDDLRRIISTSAFLCCRAGCRCACCSEGSPADSC